jgi:hypothetical protein
LALSFLCIRTDYIGRRFSQQGSKPAGTEAGSGLAAAFLPLR